VATALFYDLIEVYEIIKNRKAARLSWQPENSLAEEESRRASSRKRSIQVGLLLTTLIQALAGAVHRKHAQCAN